MASVVFWYLRVKFIVLAEILFGCLQKSLRGAQVFREESFDYKRDKKVSKANSQAHAVFSIRYPQWLCQGCAMTCLFSQCVYILLSISPIKPSPIEGPLMMVWDPNSQSLNLKKKWLQGFCVGCHVEIVIGSWVHEKNRFSIYLLHIPYIGSLYLHLPTLTQFDHSTNLIDQIWKLPQFRSPNLLFLPI